MQQGTKYHLFFLLKLVYFFFIILLCGTKHEFLSLFNTKPVSKRLKNNMRQFGSMARGIIIILLQDARHISALLKPESFRLFALYKSRDFFLYWHWSLFFFLLSLGDAKQEFLSLFKRVCFQVGKELCMSRQLSLVLFREARLNKGKGCLMLHGASLSLHGTNAEAGVCRSSRQWTFINHAFLFKLLRGKL